jgi:hypothetical protein
MRFASVLSCQRFTTQQVYATRYGFKMMRVAATFGSAQMIHLKTFWNWANQNPINQSVNDLPTVTICRILHPAIAFWIKVSDPQPATGVWFNENSVSQARR